MATKKMPIGLFVEGLAAALNRKDGYIMSAKGQDPKKWAKNSWWFTQYTSAEQRVKALEWREKAQRVWDCNGLAEGLYEEWCGVNINTYARSNYANWCSPKGAGTIPAAQRMPGAAVFIHSKKSGYITHVGYLYKPVDAQKPTGDWWVIEARGVMYGVVKTRLSQRGWNRWGLMTKYFDYANAQAPVETTFVERILRNGDEGEDVKQMQLNLIRLGYDCGDWGADGDFGDATEMAVMKFQKAHGLEADGEFGPLSSDAMDKALAVLDTKPEEPMTVQIEGGDCWVRTAPDTTGKKLGVAKRGSVLPYGGVTADNGWLLVEYENQNGYVSGKYGRLG